MDIAVDLGTCRTRVLTRNSKKILDEPTVIAYETESDRVLAVGERAEKMLGKTPPSITAVCPLAGGVIAHSSLVEEMVNIFLKKICTNRVVMPRVVACIPEDITEVERRAAVNAISSFGVRRVYLIECTKAAAMGAGLNIKEPHGHMVIDLGAGTADIAVISLDGIAASVSVKSAGDAMDEDIIKYVRKNKNLVIGKSTAKQCKEAIGTVNYDIYNFDTYILKGRDAVTGLPASAEVTAEEISAAIGDAAAQITDGILRVLEKTPPELLGDVYADGITLTGGLSAIKGISELIKEKTGIEKIKIADEPADCVVKGCALAISAIADIESGRFGQSNPLLAAY